MQRLLPIKKLRISIGKRLTVLMMALLMPFGVTTNKGISLMVKEESEIWLEESITMLKENIPRNITDAAMFNRDSEIT